MGKGVGMDNARSYASRFSGLLLFILSLAVVGVLVYLTVRSADDQSNGAVTDNGQVQEEGAQPTPVTGDDQTDDQAANNETPPPATGSEEDETPATTPPPAVAGDSVQNLPDTGPESAVAAAIAIGALVYTGKNYYDSRKLLRKP